MALFRKEPEENLKIQPTTMLQGPAPSEGRAYLDRASKISGKISFDGPARIDGEVDGEINAKDSLTIGESPELPPAGSESPRSPYEVGRWLARLPDFSVHRRDRVSCGQARASLTHREKYVGDHATGFVLPSVARRPSRSMVRLYA